MVVIDASVAAKWYLMEADRHLALALLKSREPMIAPELIIAEVSNVIWTNIRRGRVPANQFSAILDSLLPIFAELHELVPLVSRASEIAVSLDHPVYDCFYLALAERDRLRLITADDRFYRKTRRTRFSSMVRKLA